MKEKTDLKRRNFLLTAGLGGAGAAAAVMVARSGVQPEAAPAAEAVQGKGYRLTQHVANYYRTTRV